MGECSDKRGVSPEEAVATPGDVDGSRDALEGVVDDGRAGLVDLVDDGRRSDRSGSESADGAVEPHGLAGLLESHDGTVFGDVVGLDTFELVVVGHEAVPLREGLGGVEEAEVDQCGERDGLVDAVSHEEDLGLAGSGDLVVADVRDGKGEWGGHG